jgi:hypothetical protein
MKQAALTVGCFYEQFESHETLVAKRISVMKKSSTIRPIGAARGTTSHPLCSLLIGLHDPPRRTSRSAVQKTLAVRGDP